MQQLGQILALPTSGAATARNGDGDPAEAHLASAPLDRIRRLTAELQQRAGSHVDDVDAMAMGLLLSDYTAAVSHLRAVARLAEQRVTEATSPIHDASNLIRQTLKPARNTGGGVDKAAT